MNNLQGQNEIMFRLALLKITYLLENNIITEQEFKKLKKKIIKKFNPVIGKLEE